MYNYRRGDTKMQHEGYKVRVIKDELSKIYQLKLDEIVLIYENLILEDFQRLDHYNIKDEEIWCGTIEEYNREFGVHLIIQLKARNSPDVLSITERVLIKRSQHIFDLRSYLKRIYKWIDNISLFDEKENLLKDDEIIEECNLGEHLSITVGTPVFVMAKSDVSKINHPSWNSEANKMRLHPYEMSPFMEILRKITVCTESNQCFLSHILSFVRLDKPENEDVKKNFIKLISDWVKYYDRLERGEVLNGDKTSIYRQDFGEHLEDADDTVELVTLEEHFESMYSLFTTTSKFFSKYLTLFPLDDFIQKMQIVFDAFRLSHRKYNQKKFVDIRLGKLLNEYSAKFLNDGESFDLKVQGILMIQILPSFNKIMNDINSLIHDYFIRVYYFGENCFGDTFIKSGLKKDPPIQLMSPRRLTVSETCDVIKTVSSKEPVLATDQITRLLKDDEIINTDSVVSAISITKNINNFKKIRKLGKGAHGSVYLYRNTETSKQTVLKRIPKPENQTLNEVQEIIREIITSSKIAPHGRIIQYLDYYTQGEYFYIEMEYMKGGSLKTYIDSNGRLSEDKIRHFSGQILEGLKYLHEKSIIHKDIKAENVLLDDDENIKLTDFGLAKYFGEAFEKIQVPFGIQSQGTEEYMAPEISSSGIYGAPADVWSFGILMIVMITGKTPFHDRSVIISRKTLLKQGTSKFTKNLSTDLQDFVSFCLKEIPADRYTVSQLLASKFLSNDKIDKN